MRPRNKIPGKNAVGGQPYSTYAYTRNVEEDCGAGLLVLYISAVVHSDKCIPSMDVEAPERFYDVGGGQTCPMIVVLRGRDDEVVRALRNEVALRMPTIAGEHICRTTS